MVKLIAFHGPKGSGKSSAADALVKLGFTKLSFSDPLKDIIMHAIPHSESYINNPDLKDAELPGYENIDVDVAKAIIKRAKDHLWFSADLDQVVECALTDITYRSYRELMQTVATDVFRKLVSNDYWADILHKKIKDLPSETLIVVDDVRFNNELNIILKNGGSVIRVAREGVNYSDHESEQEIICDLHILNETDNLEDFKEVTQAFLIMYGLIDVKLKTDSKSEVAQLSSETPDEGALN